MAKLYRIPVVYQSAGTMEVKANSFMEALEKAIKEEPLPKDAEYLTDSIEIDEESPYFGDVLCQCGSCKNTLWESSLKNNCCPHCGSSNWVEANIDED